MRVFMVLATLILFCGVGVGHAQVERVFEGSVLEVRDDSVVVSMAGRTIRVRGEPGQYDHLQTGQRVRIQASPELEARDIRPIDDSLMERRLVGTIRDLQRDRVWIETLDEHVYTVRVADARMLRGLEEGDNVTVRLETIPDRAERWHVEEIVPF